MEEDEENDVEEVIERRVEQRGPKRKSWESLGPRAKRRASDACQKKILSAAALRQIDPVTVASHCLYRSAVQNSMSSIFTVNIMYRNAYQTNKKVAETASKIEAGQSVAPCKLVELDHATGLVTSGEHFGKLQYR